MKKKKLNLEELKVKSFITDGDVLNQETVKGGTAVSVIIICIQTRNDCPTRFACPTLLACPSRLVCPSVVDGCPSTPAPCVTDITDIQTDIINPGGH